MNKDMRREPPSRKLAAGLGLLTALVLLGASGILVMDLVSLLGVEPPHVVAKAAASAETPWMSFLAKAILTVTLILAMAIIAPAVGALCLFGLLRRYGNHLVPLNHVEHAATPPPVVGLAAAGSLNVAGAAACTAQPLNLGTSFEEERLRRAGLASRMEAGVLGQLFEDNVKLQQKIAVARDKDLATAAAR
jgi:hypothetical protein